MRKGSTAKAAAVPKRDRPQLPQYASKYGRTFSYRPTPEGYEKGHVFRAAPTKIVVFDLKHFNTSATRFTFGRAEPG